MAFNVSEECKRETWYRVQVERAERRADLRARLAAKVAEENDPNGFWAELLREHDAN